MYVALCMRCGQQSEAGAEFCDACGGHPEREAYAVASGYRVASAYPRDGSDQAGRGYRPDARNQAGDGYPGGDSDLPGDGRLTADGDLSGDGGEPAGSSLYQPGSSAPWQFSYEQGAVMAAGYQFHDPLTDRSFPAPPDTQQSRAGQVPEFTTETGDPGSRDAGWLAEPQPGGAPASYAGYQLGRGHGYQLAPVTPEATGQAGSLAGQAAAPPDQAGPVSGPPGPMAGQETTPDLLGTAAADMPGTAAADMPGTAAADSPGTAAADSPATAAAHPPMTGLAAAEAPPGSAEAPPGSTGVPPGPTQAPPRARSDGEHAASRPSMRGHRIRLASPARGNDSPGEDDADPIQPVAPASRVTSAAAPSGLPAAPAPPGKGRASTPRPHSGRWISLAAAAGVLVIAAVAVALTFGRTGAGGGKPATSDRAGSAKPASTSRGPASTPPASTPPAGGQLVTVSQAAAGSPRAVSAVLFLTRYFSAINAHDYAAYQRLFGASLRGGLSAQAFTAGYGSTRDSGIVLRGVTVTGSGQIAAMVTFTSHQQASSSPTHSACTTWYIALYLVKHDHHYLLRPPPPGYQASAAACA